MAPNAIRNRWAYRKRRLTGGASNVCNQPERGLWHIRTCRVLFKLDEFLEESFLLSQSRHARRIVEEHQQLADVQALSPILRSHNRRLRCN